MFNREIFCVRLSSLRKEHGLTLEAMGDIVGIKKQGMNDIEKGRSSTSIENLVAFADYFDVSIDYLVGRSDERERK